MTSAPFGEPVRRSRLLPYLAAVALVLAAFLIRLPLEVFLGGSAPYAMFYLAVLACAWFWGVGAAIFASLLSAVAAVWLVVPRNAAHTPESLLAFGLACIGMVVMARGARLIRGREEKANLYLASIVQSSEDAILSKDLNGIIRKCNPACERMFGYPASELVGRPVTVLIPPELQHEEVDILARLRRGERIDHFETVRMTKDGKRLEIALTISPVRDATGQIIGVSKIARDITAIKRAAREVAAQQAWFRVTLSSIGDAVIASDTDGKVIYLNGTAEQLTGWTEAEARQRPLAEVFRIINEKTRQPVEDPARRVLRVGQVVGLANHTLLLRRDGSEIPIADSAAPIQNDAGATLGVVLVFHDVSDERRTEAAIAEQREWFERTLESIGDAVIATDVHSNIVFMNPIAERLTGWRAEDARGRNCNDVFQIVHEKSRQPVENPVRKVLEEGAIVGLANRTLLIAKDGTERPVDDSGSPIRNRDGHIVGAVLVFRDVTERRTAALDRERLLEAERSARAEAERANRVKDDFLAMVSHELRTPLTAILGWTDLLLRQHEDPELVQGLEVIKRNTRVQAELISDLLDISRIESGKLILDVQNVDLSQVIEAAIETVQPAANAKGITIARRCDPAGRETLGDPARLQQVIWNLLTNAIRFTGKGGKIEVSTRRADAELELTVKDNGIGIKPAAIDRIFDRFHQRESPTTRDHRGLGLGLSIVKHLVELHGGSVRASSAGENQGATFTISLPISVTRAAGAVIETGRALASKVGPIDGSTLRDLRVLIVEDEPDTRDLIRRLIEGHGAHVSMAATAMEAMDAIAQGSPHILISDIGLPGIDGYELIQRVRLHEAESGKHIPAVALTAFARSEDRTRALRAGYQVHIAKPVEPAELVATLASFARLISPREREITDSR